jgi:mono/diheme cytochrome c family protein
MAKVLIWKQMFLARKRRRRRRGMLRTLTIGFAIAIVCAIASGQRVKKGQKFTKKQIAQGAAIFSRNCSRCHGAHMEDPNGAFDLRTFPPDEHERFVNSVTNGKNSMPAWGGLLKPVDIEALWAYVMVGERHNKTASSP